MSPVNSDKPTDSSKTPARFFFHRLRKLRLWFAWPFVLVLVIYAKSTTEGFFYGIPLIVAGEGIRMWSHGYLRKIRKLATNGPYAYVRNPLYVGNFLIGLGFCVIIFHPVIVALFWAGFFLVYWITVKGEEEKLLFKFGSPYEEYLKDVPRFLPRLTSYKNKSKSRFSFHRVWGHGEIVTILAIITLFLGVYLRQVFYQEHQPVGAVNISVSLLVLALTAAMLYLLRARKMRGREKYIRYQNYVMRRWRNWQP